jgi:hypothetical protein
MPDPRLRAETALSRGHAGGKWFYLFLPSLGADILKLDVEGKSKLDQLLTVLRGAAAI